jgi:hypothetical protein
LAANVDPDEQDKVIEPTAKTANANYITMSRYAMVVCASIDQNDPSLLDRNPIKVLQDYAEWRKDNPTLALPKLTCSSTPRDKGDTPSEEKKQKAERELREKLDRDRQEWAGVSGGIPEADASGRSPETALPQASLGSETPPEAETTEPVSGTIRRR